MNTKKHFLKVLLLPLCMSASIMYGMEHKGNARGMARIRVVARPVPVLARMEARRQTHAQRPAAIVTSQSVSAAPTNAFATPPSSPVTTTASIPDTTLSTTDSHVISDSLIFPSFPTPEQQERPGGIDNTQTPPPSPAAGPARTHHIDLFILIDRMLQLHILPLATTATPPPSPVQASSAATPEVEFVIDPLEEHMHFARIARAAMSQVPQTPILTYAPVPSLALPALAETTQRTETRIQSAPESSQSTQQSATAASSPAVSTEHIGMDHIELEIRPETRTLSDSLTPVSGLGGLSASSTSPETVRRSPVVLETLPEHTTAEAGSTASSTQPRRRSPTILEMLHETNARPTATGVGMERIVLQPRTQPSLVPSAARALAFLATQI